MTLIVLDKMPRAFLVNRSRSWDTLELARQLFNTVVIKLHLRGPTTLFPLVVSISNLRNTVAHTWITHTSVVILAWGPCRGLCWSLRYSTSCYQQSHQQRWISCCNFSCRTPISLVPSLDSSLDRTVLVVNVDLNTKEPNLAWKSSWSSWSNWISH